MCGFNFSDLAFMGSLNAAGGFDLTGLKAYYKFNNDPTGGNLINDASSVGSADSNGVDLVNTAVTQDNSGIIGNAYNYGVNSASRDGAASTDWQFLYGVDVKASINIWVKQDVVTQDGFTYIAENSNGGGGLGILFNLQGNNAVRQIRFGLFIDGSFRVGLTSAGFYPSDTNWHMITIRYDLALAGNNLSIRIDDTTTETFPMVSDGEDGTSASRFSIGGLSNLVAGLIGSVDEGSFWSRLLPDGEVTELYNSGNGFEL